MSLELAAGRRRNSQAGTPAQHELAARTTWHLTDLAEAHGKQELNDFIGGARCDVRLYNRALSGAEIAARKRPPSATHRFGELVHVLRRQ